MVSGPGHLGFGGRPGWAAPARRSAHRRTRPGGATGGVFCSDRPLASDLGRTATDDSPRGDGDPVRGNRDPGDELRNARENRRGTERFGHDGLPVLVDVDLRVLVHRDPVGSAEVSVINRLRVLRAERGWSQGDLADRLGVSRQTVNAIETGKYDPSLPLAFSIARLFERSIEAIFDPEG